MAPASKRKEDPPPDAVSRVAQIPGNPRGLERLRELVRTGEGIAFVGAGVSAGMYPLWGQLIALLAEEGVSRGLATESDRMYWLTNASRFPQQVVRGIKRSLGDNVYGATLRRIFGPQTGPDGNPFTGVQGALMRIAFRGYVTTNYDPGLLEARRILRPDVQATGYATWKDPELLSGWLTGEIVAEQSCPILFAHGVHERPVETVVLGVGEYRDAYRQGMFRRVVELSQERLVFVGFSFSDTWFEMLAEEVLTQTSRGARVGARYMSRPGSGTSSG
jgi:hypothetical protein